MMTLIMIPMWMNFLIRTYAWMTILQDTGIINGVLGAIGIEPIHVIGTETAVIIGMVYDYFPLWCCRSIDLGQSLTFVCWKRRGIWAATALRCCGAWSFR